MRVGVLKSEIDDAPGDAHKLQQKADAHDNAEQVNWKTANAARDTQSQLKYNDN